ncbi:MAG: DUF885 domain-containing protein [Candidatus Hodarchaeota archaeon]
MSENQKFEEIHNRILEVFFKYNPSIAAYLGKEEYEKELEEGTKEFYEEFVSKYSECIHELKQVDLNKLSREDRYSLRILEISNEIFQFLHKVYPIWKKSPYGLDNIQTTIFTILQRKGPTVQVVEVSNVLISKIPKFLEEFRSRFDDTPIPKIWKETALERIQLAPQFFNYLVTIFCSVSLPKSLQDDFSEIVKEAEAAIEIHKNWIQALPVDEDEFAWALGKDNFEELLRLRKLPWDRETILKKGYELLELLSTRAKQVAKEINPNKSYEEIVEEIESDHPPTFEMVLEHAKSEAERAKEFIKAHDLATVPAEESLVVVETPLYLAPIIPFAMYGPAPYYDPNRPGIYYITPIKDESELKRHSYPSISNVMVHEAYPGHHLDIYWSNVSGRESYLFSFIISLLGDETLEGWAHYCEEMMLQQGFHKESKKVELIIILGQIWRAVRIIVDVELHSKQRTFDDAVKMLVEKAKMEEGAAKAEVRRYITSPGQPLSYLIGKVLIQDLRDRVEEALGDKFSLKFFHDTLLKSCDLPYYMLKELFEEKISELK